MKLVYVCGAYRANSAFTVSGNVRAAMRAGLDVSRVGAIPVVPHSMYHGLEGEKTDEWFLEATKAVMRRRDGLYVFNRGHLRTSAGTDGEVAEATRLGLPVFYELDAIERWVLR